MEFDLIDMIRDAVGTPREDVVCGIGDDGALLRVPDGCELVAAIDTLVCGVHFPVATAPADIGWKALAVNVSDLAAMGAAPAWALVALTMPQADAGFARELTAGLLQLARQHNVALVGGDTTQGPLSITVAIHGFVPAGQGLLRSAAKAGDAVFVTGFLGDAAGGLRCLERDDDGADAVALRARLDRPQPRVHAGLALRGLAHAAIDVSDGLVADLGHICRASGLGAEVDVDALPLSAPLRSRFDLDAARQLALTGGDDYELCFSAPAERSGEVMAAMAGAGCMNAACIGRMVEGGGVHVLDAQGRDLPLPHRGWEHFAP